MIDWNKHNIIICSNQIQSEQIQKILFKKGFVWNDNNNNNDNNIYDIWKDVGLSCGDIVININEREYGKLTMGRYISDWYKCNRIRAEILLRKDKLKKLNYESYNTM